MYENYKDKIYDAVIIIINSVSVTQNWQLKI